MSNLKIIFSLVSLSQKAIQTKYLMIQIWLLMVYFWRSYSRVACETLTTTNKVVLAGEVRGPEIKKDELIDNVRNCIKILVMTKKVLLGKKLQN